jgi:hypothetical protein
MRKAYSYEGILSAVGRVLDDAAVQRVAIKDTGDGLAVEGFDAAGHSQVSLSYDVPALYEMLEPEQEAATPRSIIASDGTLRRFLEQHELVGAR